MHTIIFLNGKLPRREIIDKFITRKCVIIAADGGANLLKKIRINPHLIIGDLDSISKNTKQFFERKRIKIVKVDDQDTGDFEKCLLYCLGKNYSKVTVFGAIGKRPDHTLNNFSVLRRYYAELDIKIISDEFEILFMNKNYKFKYRINEIVSLLGLPKATKINTKGLLYPLVNGSLEFGVNEGTLNKSVASNISVSFREGDLLLFKKHFI